MKKVLCIIAVLLLVCAMIFGGFYLYNKSIDNAYNSAIALIQSASYEDALAELEKANPDVFNQKEFYADVKNQNLEATHKNSVPLYAYAMAQAEYNSEDRNMDTVNEYLKCIPDEYNGELSEEIKIFKGNFKPQYDEFLAEKKREAEEQRVIREQQEAEQLKNSLPYVGMSESKINGTVLGTNYELVHNYDWIKDKRIKANVYRFKNGDAIIFVARCLNGRVDSVYDYRDDPWVIRDIPSFDKNTEEDDPYDVNDYSDPEDFYYDNYDDFWDYEDAEDYFNEHHD